MARPHAWCEGVPEWPMKELCRTHGFSEESNAGAEDVAEQTSRRIDSALTITSRVACWTAIRACKALVRAKILAWHVLDPTWRRAPRSANPECRRARYITVHESQHRDP
jgi:hypothetical protein